MFADPDFQFSLGPPLAVFDCSGYGSNYLPYIGISSRNGTLISFENLNREKFCDAFYLVNIFKDQNSIFGMNFKTHPIQLI
jgi:hypothetical protein